MEHEWSLSSGLRHIVIRSQADPKDERSLYIRLEVCGLTTWLETDDGKFVLAKLRCIR